MGPYMRQYCLYFWGRPSNNICSHPSFLCWTIFRRLVSYRCQILVQDTNLLHLGFGVGLLSATVPLYQSETAPKWIRGTIVGCYQLSIAIGVFLSAIVANATQNRNDTGSYRIPVAIQFLFGLILVGGMLVLPETPRYLIRNGKYDAAAKSLSRLRRLGTDHPALREELAEIKGNHEHELSMGTGSYLALFRKPVRKRLLSGCAIQALQQLTGVSLQSLG